MGDDVAKKLTCATNGTGSAAVEPAPWPVSALSRQPASARQLATAPRPASSRQPAPAQQQASAVRTVLAVGAVMVDAVCQVPRLPTSGEGVVVEQVGATLGGCALNAAAAVLDAGADCCLFAPLGRGMFAGFAKKHLADLGISLFGPNDPEGGPAYDSGACVCFVEPDGQRTMVTLPGIERHFRDEWFAELDVALDAEQGAEPAAGLNDESINAAPACGFSCALASGFEVGGPGGEAIVRFFERHPQLPLFFGPGPLLTEFPPALIGRLNALHPLWHLNDQEALAFTGCATVEEAGRRIAQEAGNVCIVTAGAQGSYAFVPAAEAATRASAAESLASREVAEALDGRASAMEAAEDFGLAVSSQNAACGALEANEIAASPAAPAIRVVFAPSTPVPSDRVVDTIGAGDTHLGALAAAFAKHMSWEDALAAANEAAARVVQLKGGMLPIK